MRNTLKLPETVEVCALCHGWGEVMQAWCDAPAGHGTCDLCVGAQWVYRHNAKGVPESVRHQIANANGLVEAHRRTMRGGALFYPTVDHEQPWNAWPFQHQVDADPRFRQLLGSAFECVEASP
ncbi:hypothetical protein [Bosea sp. ANAM02]|uniref:hypothetical protein n=1 Tax=Bosea sp. ANAM02 TaxID=2020412 RepID=UPI00140EC2B8|nr:hypothetical protein [Bosea sp. ANAM02]BCB22009.1 hypothetical protein OCUBac02_49030 [Bosea sp. ANAM02]